MKATVNKDNTIQLEEVFNSIVLKTKDGEEMAKKYNVKLEDLK